MITLGKSQRFEQEIKKSRFIATAVRVDSPSEALERIEELADAGATHNCWAYKVGDQYRFFDDGEPGGTAGRPILGAIEAHRLDCVLVLVTRFFGGVKLGAGGLARAYGGTASKCLDQATLVEVRPRIPIRVRVPFEKIGAVYPLLDRFGATKLTETHGPDGLELALEVDQDAVEGFRSALANATKGAAAFEREAAE